MLWTELIWGGVIGLCVILGALGLICVILGALGLLSDWTKSREPNDFDEDYFNDS